MADDALVYRCTRWDMFTYSKAQAVTCQRCSMEAYASLWLVVSTGAPVPPFIAEGREQMHECPGCGALTVLVAPLIVMNIAHDPPMLLVPMEGASDQENREAFNWVLDLVRSAMGTAWRNDYLQNAAVMSRSQLRGLWPPD